MMDQAGNQKRVYMLSKLQMDALNEVATIGMGNAATALSQLINKKVDVTLSGTELTQVDQIAGKMSKKNMLVTGIYLRMRGDLVGTSLLFFTRDSALVLADLLNGREVGTTTVLRGLDRSALGELGSILTAAYLNSLSDMLNLKVEISVPSVVFDVASAIVYFVLLSSHQPVKHSLISRTSFESPGSEIEGEFMLLLNDKSIMNLLTALGTQL